MSFKRSLPIAVATACLVLGGCKDKKASEAGYLTQGEKYYSEGQPEKARLAFKNALRLQPTDGEPYYRLGLIDEAQGNISNAFALYTSAVQQNKHHDLALSRLAFFYFMGGKNDDAQARITTVLADQPTNLDAQALQAALYLRQGNYAACKQEALGVLAKAPSNIAATSLLAGLYSMQGDVGATSQVLEAGITANPNDVSLLILKASLFQKLKDPARVEEAYNAILRLKPENEQFRRQAAEFFLSQSRPEDAEAVLRAGVTAAPNNWQMKRAVVDFLISIKGKSAAESQILAYQQASPDNDLPAFWLADLYLKSNNSEKAIAVFQAIIDKRGFTKPGLDARVSLANATYARGDAAKAQKLLALVLEHDPENADALFSRASIEAGQGRYQDAVSDLRSVLGAHKDNVPALQALAETLMRQGHTSLAIDTMSQAVTLVPGDVAAQARLAQFYYLNKNSQRAIEILTGLTKANPENPIAWESLSRIYLDLKDWDAADTAITHFGEIKGQDLAASLLRAKWLELKGDNSGAITKLSSIVSADPSRPQAQIALGTLVDIEKRVGKIEQALIFIQKLQPQNTLTYTLQGRIYEELKKTQEAAAAFDHAIAAGPVSADPFIERARLYLIARQIDPAKQILQTGMGIMTRDTRLPLYLAQVYTELKQYPEAIKLYENMLDQNPGLDVAANNLAELVADYNYNDTHALEQARLAVERFSGSSNPLLLDTVGWVYLRSGDLNQASSYLSRAALAANAPPQVHYHYGVLLQKQGQPDQAKKELVLATPPAAQYPGVDEARQLLGTL